MKKAPDTLAKINRGGLITHAGFVDGKRLTYLEHTQECNEDTCPVVKLCTFKKDGKCMYIQDFLRDIYFGWIDKENGLGDVLNQGKLDRIGAHLMPLYSQLIRFWMDTLTIRSLTYEDKKGVARVYPQFKEFREIRKSIKEEVSDMKLDALWEQKFGDSKPKPGSDRPAPPSQDGEPGAYEELEK